MKILSLHPLAKTLALLFPALLACSSAQATTFCVSDVATLENALFFSTVLTAEPTTIKIVQGNYVTTKDWSYSSVRPLTIQGGYTNACAARVVNPANTTVSAPGHTIFLRQIGAIPQAQITIDGITFSNANDFAIKV